MSGTINSSGLYTAPATVPAGGVDTVTATSNANSTKKGTATVTITSNVSVSVNPQSTTVNTSGQQSFTATVSGSSTNTAVTWSAVSGTINASSGLYTAPATVPASGVDTVTATSNANSTKKGTATVKVTSGSNSTLSVATNSLHLAYIEQPYTAVLTGAGGAAPYTWSVSAGALPSDLSLDSTTGQLTGTPTAGGSSSVTFTATDANNATASKSFTFTVFEQPLDQYGGLTNKPCTGGPSGYFYTAEIDNRWVFCDPLGNEFWMLGIQNMVLDTSVPNQGVSYVQIVGSKYPSSTVWGTQAMFRAQSWGFNTSADYGVDYVQTFGSGSVSMPATNIFNWALYSFTNNGGYGSGPVKDLMHCINTNALALPNGDLPDVFDPNFDAYVNGRLAATANDSYYKNWLTSPWMVGGSSDDTDYLMGFGPGLEVPGVDGVVHPHIGLLSLAVSPTESSDSTWGQTYTNTTVYSKQQLQTYLKSVYSSIAALNASWGSDYTTFGSAGGWPKATTGGTGLMDEDGSSSWLGSNAGTLSGATAGVTTDLDNFLYLWAKQYFSVERTRFKQYAPNLLFMGPNTMNSHTGLTRSQILQAAGQYCDVIQAGVTTQPLLNLTAQYAGNVPILQWFGATANADSSLWRYTGPSCCDQGTQAARGTYYSNGISFLVGGTVAATGIMPVVGIKWWAWVDGWSEKANWGLVSFRDNAYDGLEAVTAQGADSWGYTTTSPYVTTGGEERNYGDFLDSVTTGNLNALRTLVSDP
jgi:hypothetical protein